MDSLPSINANTSIVTVAGAGIHFLTSVIRPKLHANKFLHYNAKYNEYTAGYPGMYFNSVDYEFSHFYNMRIENSDVDFQTEESNVITNMDKTIVSNFYKKIDVLTGHFPPVLLSKVSNLYIDEQIVITTDELTGWFVNLLSKLKQEFSYSFPQKGSLFKIHRIFTNTLKYAKDMTNTGNIADMLFTEQEFFKNNLFECFPLIEIGSIFSYRYIFDCKLKNIRINEQSLKSYCTKFYLDILANEVPYGYNVKTKKWFEYAQNYNHIPKSSVIVSYEDFYFRLNIPDLKMFEGVNKKYIELYSMRNVALMRSFSNLLEDDAKKDLENRIDQIEKTLSFMNAN